MHPLHPVGLPTRCPLLLIDVPVLRVVPLQWESFLTPRPTQDADLAGAKKEFAELKNQKIFTERLIVKYHQPLPEMLVAAAHTTTSTNVDVKRYHF